MRSIIINFVKHVCFGFSIFVLTPIAFGDGPKQPGIVLSEFVYEKSPHPQCHASTIEQTDDGLIAAWFGGTHEKNKDVGIWIARKTKSDWNKPLEIANGVQSKKLRHPCWNPVLFKISKDKLALFYKVGPSPSSWWGMVKTSGDGGKTWSKATRLPENILGPIKNKPIRINDKILCGSSTEHAGWRVHFELANQTLTDWKRIGPINDGKMFGVIQPTLFIHKDGKIQSLFRSQQNKIVQSWSEDGGKSWSKLSKLSLPNPNSGIDGVTLKNGTHLLVYNHTTRSRSGSQPAGREMLNVATTNDGLKWNAALVLEKQSGEFSYPAVIQNSDGLVHITYTHLRKKVKHVVVDPAKLKTIPIKDGVWPGLE